MQIPPTFRHLNSRWYKRNASVESAPRIRCGIVMNQTHLFPSSFMKPFHAPRNIPHMEPRWLSAKKKDVCTSAYCSGNLRVSVLIQKTPARVPILSFAMTTFGRTTHIYVRHTVRPPPNNKGRTKNRDLFSMVPVMKRNRRLRPRFLYEPLSCILHTSSCLKDDPAWGRNMKTKWEKSRLTIYCCVKEIWVLIYWSEYFD